MLPVTLTLQRHSCDVMCFYFFATAYISLWKCVQFALLVWLPQLFLKSSLCAPEDQGSNSPWKMRRASI